MKVYTKIAAIQAALAKTGIAKTGRNTQQGYNFRGIDQVYEALAPLLAEHGLCILPRMISREVVERQSQKGGALFNVCVEAEFDFVAAEDGSKHVVRTFGEAMDSADKATNKAMSAAYKYAALMTFAVPTEGDNDADNTTHDVAPTRHEIDPGAFISDKARDKLAMLIEASGSDVAAFCREHGVMTLKELTNERATALAGLLKQAKAA